VTSRRFFDPSEIIDVMPAVAKKLPARVVELANPRGIRLVT